MPKERDRATDRLAGFIGSAKCLEDQDRIHLLALIADLKPAASVVLHITPQNLDEKYHFENHLAQRHIVFVVSKPRTFERITNVRNDVVRWHDAGVYYEYHVARSKTALIAAKKRNEYGYPQCCVTAFHHHLKQPPLTPRAATQRVRFIHNVRKRYPFITYIPHAMGCSTTQKLNERYSSAIKRLASTFWARYLRGERYRAKLLVLDDDFTTGHFVGHHYHLVSLAPARRKYYQHELITTCAYPIGTTLDATIRIGGQSETIKVARAHPRRTRIIHLRKHPLLGRKK